MLWQEEEMSHQEKEIDILNRNRQVDHLFIGTHN